MAKCDLSIELETPHDFHPGGGRVRGMVHVDVDENVTCKGLEVTSAWRTHGRGNVAQGTAGSMTLYEGQWTAGQRESYQFELPIADWPPSYHGHYLNIDHYVDVRAKIPWAFDPKDSVPFLVRPTCGPEEAVVDKNVVKLSGMVGLLFAVLIFVFIFIFCGVLASIGPFALFLLIVPAGVGLWWFFRRYLPRRALGHVECSFEQPHVAPGQQVTGELVIKPKKNIDINGVSLRLRVIEQCTRGSGSNRTTHTHELSDHTHALREAGTLEMEREYRIPLNVAIPIDSPYSIELNDNKLKWTATLRVDIPRWPDWTKDLPIVVAPAGQRPPSSETMESLTQQGELPSQPVVVATGSAVAGSAVAGGTASGTEAGVTFEETVQHLWGVRDDRDKAEMVASAVSGLTFSIQATIERRLLYSGDDPNVYEDGYAVWARYPDPPLPLVLYVPHDLADEFEQVGRGNWKGVGQVIGWDDIHGRLQLKLIPRKGTLAG